MCLSSLLSIDLQDDNKVVESVYIPGPSQQYLKKGFKIITDTVEKEEPMRHKQLAIKRVLKSDATIVMVDLIICQSKDDISKIYTKLMWVRERVGQGECWSGRVWVRACVGQGECGSGRVWIRESVGQASVGQGECGSGQVWVRVSVSQGKCGSGRVWERLGVSRRCCMCHLSIIKKMYCMNQHHMRTH